MMIASQGIAIDRIVELMLLGILTAGSLCSLFFAVQAYQNSVRLQRFSSYVELKRLITQINGQVLQSEDLLAIADDLVYARDKDGIDPRRRWIAFGILNVLEVAYRSLPLGADRDYIHAKFGHLGKRLFAPWTDENGVEHTREDVYQILRYGGYDKGFVEFCTTLSPTLLEWYRRNGLEEEKMDRRKMKGYD